MKPPKMRLGTLLLLMVIAAMAFALIVEKRRNAALRADIDEAQRQAAIRALERGWEAVRREQGKGNFDPYRPPGGK